MYGALNRQGQVRLATWPRDRIGCVRVVRDSAVRSPHLWTCPFRSPDGPVHVLLNVAGLSHLSRVTVEVADERFQPIDGRRADDCLTVEDGLRSPVKWRSGCTVPASSRPVRLRVNIDDPCARDVKLYGIYVTQAAT